MQTWESKLQKLRQELGVRTIARNITSTQVPYAVKVLAYQNGNGRNAAPQLIIGSSIAGVCVCVCVCSSSSSSNRFCCCSNGCCALTLLVGRQEERPACKRLIRCLAICLLMVQLVPLSHHYLLLH